MLASLRLFVATLLVINVLGNNLESEIKLSLKDIENENRFLSTNPDPKGAYPMLVTDYVSKGKVTSISASATLTTALPIYEIGTPNASRNNTIIYVYDIYGFEMGRTRQICDKIAEAGYYVVLPGFHRGIYSGITGFDMANFPLTKINVDLAAVYAYIDTKTTQKGFVMIGACWGGWVVFETSMVSDRLIAGISYHPALTDARMSTTYPLMADRLKVTQLAFITLQENAGFKTKRNNVQPIES